MTLSLEFCVSSEDYNFFSADSRLEGMALCNKNSLLKCSRIGTYLLFIDILFSYNDEVKIPRLLTKTGTNYSKRCRRDEYRLSSWSNVNVAKGFETPLGIAKAT